MRDLLIDLAVEPDIVRAMRIASRLQQQSPRASHDEIDLLAWAIAAEDPVTAIGALHALAGVARNGIDDLLVDALWDERPWIREHAAWVLSARRPQPRAVAPLAGMLDGRSALTAMVAQRTLVAWSGVPNAVDLVGTLERALGSADVAEHRRRLVDTIGATGDTRAAAVLCGILDAAEDHESVRVAAAAGLAVSRNVVVDSLLRRYADHSGDIGTAALLALDDAAVADVLSMPLTGRGLRIGQLSLTYEFDADRLGRGDSGGVATLLHSLSGAFARHVSVESVVTIGRSSLAEELTSLLLPDTGPEAEASIAVGTASVELCEAWDRRLTIERSIRRVLRNRPMLDVLHLRMADVGTLAAASVARHLGVPVAFTCAPDPHAPIESRQQAGQLDRDSFGQVDIDEHLWFRARMVERLADQADQLVLLPRKGAVARVHRLIDIDTERLERDGIVVPEGIDVSVVDAALDGVTAGTSRIAADLGCRIPPGRLGLPMVVTVGRLHPVKGVSRIVSDWLADAELASSTNLVIVGGDVVDPSPTERAVLEAIHDRRDGDVNGDGVILLGALRHSDAAEVMAVGRLGSTDRIAPGGVYVNGAAKEEFGLALLEALATGLPVVAPREGGPATYVADDAGVLVGPLEPLGPALRQAIALFDEPGRIDRVRSMVEERYTIGACADALVTAYERVSVAGRR